MPKILKVMDEYYKLCQKDVFFAIASSFTIIFSAIFLCSLILAVILSSLGVETLGR